MCRVPQLIYDTLHKPLDFTYKQSNSTSVPCCW
jgi:hypothetical protein